MIEDDRFKSMFEDDEFKRDETLKPTVSQLHVANLPLWCRFPIAAAQATVKRKTRRLSHGVG